jgi:hypothetical protein
VGNLLAAQGGGGTPQGDVDLSGVEGDIESVRGQVSNLKGKVGNNEEAIAELRAELDALEAEVDADVDDGGDTDGGSVARNILDGIFG